MSNLSPGVYAVCLAAHRPAAKPIDGCFIAMCDDDGVCLRTIPSRRDHIIIRQLSPVLARCSFDTQPAVCYQIAHAALAVVTNGHKTPLPHPLVDGFFGLKAVVIQVLSVLGRHNQGKTALTCG